MAIPSTILAAIISGIVAALIVPYVTFRLNEHQRRLELYKIVYPEKFRAIKEFMGRAYDLQIEVINAPKDPKNVSVDQKLVEKIKQLSREADANRWLFGENITESIHQIRSIMMNKQFGSAQPSADLELSKAFDVFNVTIDKELQITKLSNTFK